MLEILSLSRARRWTWNVYQRLVCLKGHDDDIDDDDDDDDNDDNGDDDGDDVDDGDDDGTCLHKEIYACLHVCT